MYHVQQSNMTSTPPLLPDSLHPLKVLFISLEFLGPLFSGNGTYSRSIIKSLSSTVLPRFSFLILSGMPILPSDPTNSNNTDNSLHNIPPEAYLPSTDTAYRHPKIWDPDLHYLLQNHQIIGIPLPSWGKLHRYSSWKEFGTLVSTSPSVGKTIEAFAPELIMYVDWTGYIVYQCLSESYPSFNLSKIPRIYLNFRIFTTSTALHEPQRVNNYTATPLSETPVIEPLLPSETIAARLESTLLTSSTTATITPTVSSILVDNENDESDMNFYQRMEILALHASNITVCLCRTDYCHLNALYYLINPVTYNRINFSYHPSYTTVYRPLLRQQRQRTYQTRTINYADIRIVLPPLRSDIYDLAIHINSSTNNNIPWTNTLHQATGLTDLGEKERLLTSVVRLSPEKGTLFFSQLIDALQNKEPLTMDKVSKYSSVLLRYRLCALLCGSSPDPQYAQLVRSTLLSARRIRIHPEENNKDYHTILEQENQRMLLISSFLNAHDMAAIYSRSLINVHPSLADAYGMTIVEAAAFGVPSIIHIPSSIELLQLDHHKNYPPSVLDSIHAIDIQSYFTTSTGYATNRPLLGYIQFTLSSFLDRLIDLYVSHCTSDTILSPDNVTIDKSIKDESSLPILIGSTFVSLSSSLPSIGACDLLGAPRILLRTSKNNTITTNNDRSSHTNPSVSINETGTSVDNSIGILPMDITLSPSMIAETVLDWIHENNNDNNNDTVPYLQQVKRIAQERALGWQEKHNGEALAGIMQELVQARGSLLH